MSNRVDPIDRPRVLKQLLNEPMKYEYGEYLSMHCLTYWGAFNGVFQPEDTDRMPDGKKAWEFFDDMARDGLLERHMPSNAMRNSRFRMYTLTPYGLMKLAQWLDANVDEGAADE